MFPTFRKLNEKCFFKIYDSSRFEELKIIGNKFMFTDVNVNQLPERIYLQDILEAGLEITKEEFESKLWECNMNYKKIML